MVHKMQMSDSDASRLIKEVKKRGCIWNPDDENYSDRYHLSVAWEDIAKTLGMPEEVLRVKWKNLRDCFKKEVKRNGIDAIDQYGGRWRHFKPLGFLMRPEAAGEEEEGEIEEEERTSSEADQAEISYKYVPDTSVEYLEEDPISPIPEKRAKTVDGEDYDLMFLKSLTPFLKQLEPTRNLVVRSRMQDMLLNEIAAQNMSVNKNINKKS